MRPGRCRPRAGSPRLGSGWACGSCRARQPGAAAGRRCLRPGGPRPVRARPGAEPGRGPAAALRPATRRAGPLVPRPREPPARAHRPVRLARRGGRGAARGAGARGPGRRGSRRRQAPARCRPHRRPSPRDACPSRDGGSARRYVVSQDHARPHARSPSAWHASSPPASCRSTTPRSPFTVSTTPPSVNPAALPEASPKNTGRAAPDPTRPTVPAHIKKGNPSGAAQPHPQHQRHEPATGPLPHRPGAAANQDRRHTTAGHPRRHPQCRHPAPRSES
jgi:hypothetical protein